MNLKSWIFYLQIKIYQTRRSIQKDGFIFFVNFGNKIVINGDQDFLAITVDLKKCLRAIVVDSLNNSYVSIINIYRGIANNFVKIKFIALKFGKHCERKVNVTFHNFISFLFRVHILKSHPEQGASVEGTFDNKKWNQIFVDVNEN